MTDKIEKIINNAKLFLYEFYIISYRNISENRDF